MDGLQSLAVLEWLRHIDDLAFWAECPSSDPPTDDWARGYRDKINGGTAGAIAWLHQRNGRPWPPQAEMTREGLQSAVRRLASDALHLVTTIQNADCWGVRYSAWHCAADRELVDRVRSRVHALREVIEFLTTAEVEPPKIPDNGDPATVPSKTATAADDDRDPIEDALGAQQLVLYRCLKRSRHWVNYTTLANEDCDWKDPPPEDHVVHRALKKLQSALSNLTHAPALKDEYKDRRAKLIPPVT